MEDVTLLLYLKDAEYGKRLLRFLVQKKNPGLHPELVTAKSKIEFRTGTESSKLVVLTDDTAIYGDGKRKVINLSNNQNREPGKIFQFQKAENIYQELLWQLKLESERKSFPERKEEILEKEILVIFSPDSAGATELAVMVSQYMAQRGKCLYLQLSGYPVYFGEELRNEIYDAPKGIGELLFMLDQEDFAGRVKQLNRRFGKADMLPPLAHYKDLLDCRPQEWEHFLKRLKTECGYDSIIVEMGQIYEYFLDLMELADKVLFLQPEGMIGSVQRAVFQRYCRIEQKEELLARTKYILQPGDFALARKEWGNMSLEELADNGQKMECVRRVLEGGEKGDDYIMEDFG